MTCGAAVARRAGCWPASGRGGGCPRSCGVVHRPGRRSATSRGRAPRGSARSRPASAGQAAALDQLHREVRPAVVLADLVDRHDVRVVEAGRPPRPRPGSAARSLGRRRAAPARIIFRATSRFEADLPGPVDDAHAAAGDLLEQLVVAEVPHHTGRGRLGDICPRPSLSGDRTLGAGGPRTRLGLGGRRPPARRGWSFRRRLRGGRRCPLEMAAPPSASFSRLAGRALGARLGQGLPQSGQDRASVMIGPPSRPRAKSYLQDKETASELTRIDRHSASFPPERRTARGTSSSTSAGSSTVAATRARIPVLADPLLRADGEPPAPPPRKSQPPAIAAYGRAMGSPVRVDFNASNCSPFPVPSNSPRNRSNTPSSRVIAERGPGRSLRESGRGPARGDSVPPRRRRRTARGRPQRRRASGPWPCRARSRGSACRRPAGMTGTVPSCCPPPWRRSSPESGRRTPGSKSAARSGSWPLRRMKA